MALTTEVVTFLAGFPNIVFLSPAQQVLLEAVEGAQR